MNMIYLKNTDEHLNLDRIERVRHDVVLPVVASGEGLTIVKKMATVVYLMGDSDTRLHVYDSDDRALLREQLDVIAKVVNTDAATPDDDWRNHGTVGYDARMSETTGPSNMVLGRRNVFAGPSAGKAKVPPDQLIGSNAGRAVTYLTGYPLGQPSTFECPWRGCGKDISIAMDCCRTETTWSLFQCRSCGKLCASGNVPDAVKMDPEILIIDYKE